MNWKGQRMQDLVPTWNSSFAIRTMLENLKVNGVYCAEEDRIQAWRQVVFTRIQTELPHGMHVVGWCRMRAPRLL